MKNHPDKASEVLKKANNQAKLLGKTYGELQNELLTPLMKRFIMIAEKNGLLEGKDND